MKDRKRQLHIAEARISDTDGERRLASSAVDPYRPVEFLHCRPSGRDDLVGAQQDHVRNHDAEPKHWMRVRAPVRFAAFDTRLPVEMRRNHPVNDLQYRRKQFARRRGCAAGSADFTHLNCKRILLCMFHCLNLFPGKRKHRTIHGMYPIWLLAHLQVLVEAGLDSFECGRRQMF